MTRFEQISLAHIVSKVSNRTTKSNQFFNSVNYFIAHNAGTDVMLKNKQYSLKNLLKCVTIHDQTAFSIYTYLGCIYC